MPLTPRQAARKIRAARARLVKNVTAAVVETQKDVLQTAVKHSQGRMTLAELARAGHPYAVRHAFATAGGGGPFGGGVINYQSGLFADSWTWSAPVRVGGAIRGRVWNTAPYASFLETGTLLMWARPLNHLVAQECLPRFQQRMRRALDKSLTF